MKNKTTKNHPTFTLIKLEVNGLEFTVIKYRSENNIPLYSCKHPVIYFVLEGEYRISAKGKTFSCSKGDALLIKDGQQLPVEVAKAGVTVFAFQINPEWCAQFGFQLPDVAPREFIKGSLIHSLVALLYKKYLLNQKTAYIGIQGVFLYLLEELILEEERTKPEENTCLPAGRDWATLLRPVINNLPLGKLNQDYLAALAKVHPVTISKGFEQEFGVLFREFVLRRKLEAARALLTDTEINVKAISERCLFSTPLRFKSAFVKEYGITPDEYRKALKAD